MFSNKVDQKPEIYKNNDCETYGQECGVFVLNFNSEEFIKFEKQLDELKRLWKPLGSEISEVRKIVDGFCDVVHELAKKINATADQYIQMAKGLQPDIGKLSLLYDQLTADFLAILDLYEQISNIKVMPSIIEFKNQLICQKEEMKKAFSLALRDERYLTLTHEDSSNYLNYIERYLTTYWDRLIYIEAIFLAHEELMQLSNESRSGLLEIKDLLKIKIDSVLEARKKIQSISNLNPALYSANKTHTPGQFQPATPQISVKALSEQAANLNIGAGSLPPKAN